MKSPYLFLAVLYFVMVSCSNDAEKFGGTWQSVQDPSKQLTITPSEKSYLIETKNIEPSAQGLTGTYNADKDALELDKGNGDISVLTYNASTNHLVGFGDEFEKTTNTVTENAEAERTSEETTEATPTEDAGLAENAVNCGKGDILLITGNNVRVRNEPDLTKQNILFQVHKNYEVVHLDDKTVDGQKWYKVCYDGNIGWVSGQYAVKK